MNPYAIAALTLLGMAALATVIVLVVVRKVGREYDEAKQYEQPGESER